MTKAWHLVCIGLFDDDMEFDKVGEFIEIATNHKVTVQEVKPLPRELPQSDLPNHWMDRVYCLEDAVHELYRARTAVHGQGGRIGKLERKLKYVEAQIGRLDTRVERVESREKEQSIGQAGYSTIINRINELEDEVRLYSNGYRDLKRQYEALYDNADSKTTSMPAPGWSFTCDRCHSVINGPKPESQVEWLCEECAEHDTVVQVDALKGEE